MNIYEKVEIAKYECTQKVSEGYDVQLNAKRYRALGEISLYILNLNYVVNINSKEKMLAFFETYVKGRMRCSSRYRIVAEKYKDITHTKNDLKRLEHSIHVLITTTLNKVEKTIVGKDTVDSIIKGSEKDIEDALSSFRKRAYISTPIFFPKGVTELLPEAEKNEELQLKDCLEELIFLSIISSKNIKSFSHIRKEKVSFLLSIIEEANYSFEKKVICDFLDGSIEIEQLMKQLS